METKSSLCHFCRDQPAWSLIRNSEMFKLVDITTRILLLCQVQTRSLSFLYSYIPQIVTFPKILENASITQLKFFYQTTYEIFSFFRFIFILTLSRMIMCHPRPSKANNPNSGDLIWWLIWGYYNNS